MKQIIVTLAFVLFVNDVKSQEKALTIHIAKDRLQLGEFIELLERDHSLNFGYAANEIDLEETLRFKIGYYPIEELLRTAGQQGGFTFILNENRVLLKKVETNQRTLSAVGQSLKVKAVENDPIATALFGATVVLKETNQGVVTNFLGKATLTGIVPGLYTLEASFVGYEKKLMTVQFPKDKDITIRLDASATQLDEVVVSAETYTAPREVNALNDMVVEGRELNYMPRFLGEPDLIRALQTVPGVKTDTDFTGGFSVRGGKNDQNLILLDGVPVYNPWHLFGIFSAFNAEAVGRATLMKGAFPAQYGGRASSVLDVHLVDALYNEREGSIHVSPLSATFHYGIPINQNNSVMIAARRTYMDPLLLLVNELTSTEGSTSSRSRTNYHFTDFNLKAISRLTDKSRLTTSILFANDRFKDKSTLTSEPFFGGSSKDNLGVRWSSLSGSVAHAYDIRQDWTLSNQLYATRYRVVNDQNSVSSLRGSSDPDERQYIQLFSQNLVDLSYALDATKRFGDNHAVNLGAQMISHVFEEENTSSERKLETTSLEPQRDTLLVTLNRSNRFTKSQKPLEVVTHATYRFTNDTWAVNLGVRAHYWNQGSYLDVMPRVNVSYRVSPSWKWTAGYGHNTQYLQSLSLDFLRLPSEQWFWANENIRPLRARIGTLGTEYTWPGGISLAAEAYYKESQGVLNYSPIQQASLIESGSDSDAILPMFTNEFVEGDGQAYGLEVMLRKSSGKLTGWIGYTLSWAWNEFDAINGGARFPARTDRRHDIQSYALYDLSDNWSFSAVFNFRTGQPVTYSTNYTIPVTDPLGVNDFGGEEQVFTGYHNFRIPNYHRLDLALIWKNRKIFKRKSEITLSVINAYNRQNVLFFSSGTRINQLADGRYRAQPNDTFATQLPILPMISVRIGLGKENRWKE